MVNGERRVRTNYTGSAIPDLIILALGQLYEQLGDLVLDLHLAEDSRTIIRNSDLAIRGDEDFIQPYGTSCEFECGAMANGHARTSWTQ